MTTNPKTGDAASRLLTIADTAERLNVSPRTVRRLIDAGQLPIIRIGRAVRIAEDDLERAVAEWRETVTL